MYKQKLPKMIANGMFSMFQKMAKTTDYISIIKVNSKDLLRTIYGC